LIGDFKLSLTGVGEGNQILTQAILLIINDILNIGKGMKGNLFQI